MTKEQKLIEAQRKQAKKEEYREYRKILRSIACDPYEVSETRIAAIQAVFDYDDKRRELAGFQY